ncbi:LytR/AlgR family response regulator transcription factor [Mucilaginibacter sp.]
MKCIIVDDEPHAIKILEAYISEVPDLELTEAFTDPMQVSTFLSKNNIDIVFLDVNMPKLSGIGLLSLMKGSNRKPFVILNSAHLEYAVEGFENEAVDYLLKPFSFERFLKAIQKIRTIKEYMGSDAISRNDDFIFVKVDTKNKSVKINLSEIIYIEGLGNFISIFTPKERFVTSVSMQSIEKTLPQNQFMRVHKSYIISTFRINKIDGNRIYINDYLGVIPLGDSYKTKFADFLLKNSIR